MLAIWHVRNVSIVLATQERSGLYGPATAVRLPALPTSAMGQKWILVVISCQLVPSGSVGIARAGERWGWIGDVSPGLPEKVMTMVSSLPAEYLDPGTPPEVVVTDQIRPPITDSTLGVPLGVPGPGLPSVPDPPRHQLVTVGDSLTHGMSSGAVFHTDLSWPALVARSLGAD